MATDSRKDNDKDRHMPVHNGGGDTLRRIEVITGVASGLNLTENRRFEFAVAAAAGAVD